MKIKTRTSVNYNKTFLIKTILSSSLKHVFDSLVQQFKKVKIKIANAVKLLVLNYYDDVYRVVFAVITCKYSTHCLKYIMLCAHKN